MWVKSILNCDDAVVGVYQHYRQEACWHMPRKIRHWYHHGHRQGLLWLPVLCQQLKPSGRARMSLTTTYLIRLTWRGYIFLLCESVLLMWCYLWNIYTVSLRQAHNATFIKVLQSACRLYNCTWLNSLQKTNIEGCIKTLADVGKFHFLKDVSFNPNIRPACDRGFWFACKMVFLMNGHTWYLKSSCKLIFLTCF